MIKINKRYKLLKSNSKVRLFMRGYNILKNKNDLYSIPLIRKKIGSTFLNSQVNHSSQTFFGSSNSNLELTLRQFLLTKLIGIDFNMKLLSSFAKPNRRILYPIPKEWRVLLDKSGFVSDFFLNRIYWNLYVLFIFCYGVYLNLIRFFHSFINIIRNRKTDYSRGISFQKLAYNNLPVSNNSHTIINWYHNYFGKKENNLYYMHDVNTNSSFSVDNVQLKKVRDSGFLPQSFNKLIKYFLWFIWAFFFSFYKFLNGKYWYMILFNEASLAFLARNTDSRIMPEKFLFHQIGHLLKPLWTYEVEKFNKRVYLYFYATNIENLKFNNEPLVQDHFWENTSWNNFLVWNDNQANFIKKYCKKPSVITIVEPIYFNTNNNLKLDRSVESKNYVAIFDIQPFRTSFFQLFGAGQEYYTAKVANLFLNDIFEVTNKYKLLLVHKLKRDLSIYGSLENITFKKNLLSLKKQKRFISVNPEISAFKIIDHSLVTISMPFTSSSVYAKFRNKPTFFYDPTSKLDNSYFKKNKILLISGKDELENWFNFFLNN
jgi:polysaccharide biosynthesis PFTS motif protein